MFAKSKEIQSLFYVDEISRDRLVMTSLRKKMDK